jgi:glycerate kinase
VVLAPDKFKGSMTAHEVAVALGDGLRSSGRTATCLVHPVADGGDGLLEALAGHGYQTHLVDADNALGGPVLAPLV